MRVREEFRPTLPEIVARRFGIERSLAARLLAGTVIALVAVALLVRGGDGRTTFSHERSPAFELEYPEALLEPLAPRAGELAAFEVRRGPLAITLEVAAADFPGRPLSDLPTIAALRAQELREQIPGLEVREEGRTRLDRQPAYELNYRYGEPPRRTFGRDVLVFSEEASTLDDGVLISTRTVKPGPPLTDAERDIAKAVRRAANSLQLG